MNKKIIISIISITALLLTIGLTYAYFRGHIVGEDKEIVLIGKNQDLRIIYSDDSDLSGNITPDWSATKEFSVENKSPDVFTYNIILKDLVNTFVTKETLLYKVTSVDGGYSMKDFEPIPKSESPSDIILIPNIDIKSGTKQNYIIEFKYIISEYENQTLLDKNSVLSGKVYITEGIDKQNPLANKLLKNNKVIGTRDDFSKSFDELGIKAGLYEESGNFTEDMDGDEKGETVYYFVGDVENNWVKFGKEGENDIWWRIIRTNEDGSVRLLYAGTSPDTSTGYIDSKTYAYNNTYNYPKYVGYMYGKAGSTLAEDRKNDTESPIKKIIDKWYDINMTQTDGQNHTYGSYLSNTAIYCNDRSTQKYSLNEMYYGPTMRITNNASSYGGVSSANEYHPTFKCGGNVDGNGTGLYANGGDVADKFTGSNKSGIGNQLLGDAPIALMTVDEVAYAGGLYNTNNSSAWYYQNSIGGSVTGNARWWTMSPYFHSKSAYARTFFVYADTFPGRISAGMVDISNTGVRPVLSLKSCVSASGTGTTEDPYIPIIDDACALADN